MARFSVSGRSTVAPTSARGGVSLFNVASGTQPVIREIAVSQTTATAQCLAVARFTNATGVGAGLTEAEHNAVSAALATAFAGHTVDGGVGDEICRATLGAAVGAGWVWTFGAEGLIIPAGTANGVGVLCPVGTGQIFDYTVTWDE